MRPVRIRAIARAEIAEAFDWYLARSPRAAAEFIEALDAAISGIEGAPERHGPVHGNLRRWLLRGFPYGVYYKVYEGVISVVGIIHGSRHPEQWRRRAEP
ncbi:MAG: type II toxin-antitoxin system RelE/ParE family toxin [Gemmatimonadaceae bacterium]